VSPTYTYQVDITGPESELLDRFSRDARSNVRDAAEIDYDFGERGPEAIDRILEQVRARYESQDITFGVPLEFVRDLYEQTPEGTVRPYTCRIDDEFVGGILAFVAGDRIARWQGGVKPAEDRALAVNDVLDWEVMRAGRDIGCASYDLVGADNERISQYKSKFDPELVPFYDIERANWLGSLAARVYKARK
jgi:lipid II:glycine glycyltransferase (peptidoglycan interpeptide bridge formation enzyme)